MENPIVELYADGLWECQMVSTLLTDAGIENFLRNDLSATYVGVPEVVQTVSVMIGQNDFSTALELVKQFQESRGISSQCSQE